MAEPKLITAEASLLATELIKRDLLSMRQLQQGLEWCARNKETLVTFLERFTKNPNAAFDSASSELLRRHFARHPSRCELWIEAEAKLVEVRALNVSRGGLAFRSRWALARDSTIQLGTEQQVQAVVRYCVDNGDGTATCGAEFAPKTVSELQAIEALLQSLEAQVQS